MDRKELAVEAKHTELLEALAKAKAGLGENPTAARIAKMKEAQLELQAFRIKQRESRVPTDAAPDDGVAAPESVQVTTEGG